MKPGVAHTASFFDRNAGIQQLANHGRQWDVLVIGGGATGLGIALDAVSRGYSTVLVEQADFAKGTSSRSTKLVHGGVRYLAQGDVKLVREASIERGLLHRNAPHLVKDQIFIVPVYNWWQRLKYTIGLKLYDAIAGKLSLGPSHFISKKETLRKLPGLKPEGLVGGVEYHDGQFDDARLALNLAQTIWEQGGLALNYVKVVNLFKDDNGHVNGASVTDQEIGKTYNIHAKAVVNATGVFVDDILQMDNPAAGKSIRVSQGIHLVLDKRFQPSADAMMIPETSDGRVLFAVPWHQKLVVGTTDTPVGAASLEPQALEAEIEFILQTAGQYLTMPPRRSDVLSVFAGLRPLAAPKGNTNKTKEISRSHKITVTRSRLFTMLGGKWTTYRKMGQDMMDRIERDLQWGHKPSATAAMQIHGFNKPADFNEPLYYYGSDAAALRQQVSNDPHGWLSTGLHVHRAQVAWAVTGEMARTVEDVLARRTRSLLLDAREARRIAPAVAEIMAAQLGYSTQWQQQQLHYFDQLTQQYVLDNQPLTVAAEVP